MEDRVGQGKQPWRRPTPRTPLKSGINSVLSLMSAVVTTGLVYNEQTKEVEQKQEVKKKLDGDQKQSECTPTVEVDNFMKSVIREPSQKPQAILNLDKLCHLDVSSKGSQKRVDAKNQGGKRDRTLQKPKRKIGLHDINKRILKFKDFLPLHRLWKDYMQNVLNIKQLKRHGFTGNALDKQWKQCSMKLLRAEYQGAFLRVQKSTCVSNVGTSGIVVYDTKSTYTLLGRDNVLRTVPKLTSVFQLCLDSYEFTIYGRDMCIRPVLRTTKKIKKYLIADL